MLLYLFTFILSILFTYIASLYYKNMMIFNLFSAVAVTPLIIIGGLRDVGVGYDTIAYPVSAYNYLQINNNIYSILFASAELEPLYYFLSYLAVNYFWNDVGAILFVTQLIIIVVTYVACCRIVGRSYLWISIFLYCFLFFNMELNMMRQGLALSFVLLGFSYLLDHKLKGYFICILVGFLFHKSAIFALVFLPGVYWKNLRYSKYIVIGSLAFLMFFSTILNFITSLEGFSKYDAYSEGGNYSGTFSYSEFILRTLFLLCIYFLCSNKKKDIHFYQIFALFVCEFVLNILQIKSDFVGRLGLPIYILYLVYLPYYCMINTSTWKIKKSNTVLLLFVVFLYWWYVYMVSDAGVTVDYSSSILGIH